MHCREQRCKASAGHLSCVHVTTRANSSKTEVSCPWIFPGQAGDGKLQRAKTT